MGQSSLFLTAGKLTHDHAHTNRTCVPRDHEAALTFFYLAANTSIHLKTKRKKGFHGAALA